MLVVEVQVVVQLEVGFKQREQVFKVAVIAVAVMGQVPREGVQGVKGAKLNPMHQRI